MSHSPLVPGYFSPKTHKSSQSATFSDLLYQTRKTKRSNLFSLARSSGSARGSWATFSNNSRSAPRSGNAATLPTLQMESRHAASATPPAFRHRKHDQERQPARPSMWTPRSGDSAAKMKRGGAEVAPASTSGAGAAHSSMGLQTQIPSPVAGGARPTVPCHMSRSTSSTLCRDAWRPCCCANWTRPALQCFPVPVCGPLYVIHMAFLQVMACGLVKLA